MNTLTLNFRDVQLPIFRFIDDAIADAFKPSGDTGAGKIAQGQQDIKDGDTEKGEGEILEGAGKLIEEKTNENEENTDEA